MYVSVPKNYSGIAFSQENRTQGEMQIQPMTMPLPMPPGTPQGFPEPPIQKKEECYDAEPPCEEPKTPAACKDCKKQDKNPLTCLLTALRDRGKSGFDTEDFLLIGLIALLLGKEGNEDIILVLAMLLLI